MAKLGHKLKKIEFEVTCPATWEIHDVQKAADKLYRLWSHEKLNGAKTNLKIVGYGVEFQRY